MEYISMANTRFQPPVAAVGWALVPCALALALGCGGPAGRADITPGTMPQGGNFHGAYHSPQYGEMNLCQSGSALTGTFEQNERAGTIQGTVQGDVLRFSWTEERELVPGRPTESRGRGYFRYTIEADDNHYLVGEWGLDDSEIGGGPWRAVRLRGSRGNPQCNRGSGSTSGGSNSDSSGSPSPATRPAPSSDPDPTQDSGSDGLQGI